MTSPRSNNILSAAIEGFLNELKWQTRLVALQLRVLVGDHWVAILFLCIGGLLFRGLVWWGIAAPLIPLSKWVLGAWEIGASTIFYVALSLYISGFAIQSEIEYSDHPRVRHEPRTDQDTVEYPNGNRGILSVTLVVVTALVALIMAVPFAVVLITIALQTGAHVPKGLDAVGRGVISHAGIMLYLLFLLWMLLVV